MVHQVAVIVFLYLFAIGETSLGGNAVLNLQGNQVDVVPQPAQVEFLHDVIQVFPLPHDTPPVWRVHDASGKQWHEVVRSMNMDIILELEPDAQSADVIMQCGAVSVPGRLEAEGYILEVNPITRKVYITSQEKAGVLYAWQTLLQLVTRARDGNHSLSQVTITDAPKLPWRGLMLDVSRHFFPVDDIKKLLDCMLMVKLNRLHLHLTDGPGWRLEVKSDPRLTLMGSYREPSTKAGWDWRNLRFTTLQDNPKAYGGYLTQEQIRELIVYAAQRNITIVPEVDAPGHACSILLAYPHLACIHNQNPVGWQRGNDVLCVGNPETLRLLKRILSEMDSIFPKGAPFHLGGDEVPSGVWDMCDNCRKLASDLGLSKVQDLNQYFHATLNEHLESLGRHAIVWDEALHGALNDKAVVMAWRDTQANQLAVRACKQGHKVVLTPASHFYFDYYQSADRSKEPLAIGGKITLADVYSYKMPEHENIMGLQGNVWTEYMPEFQHVQYMIWPRGFALSERAWSGNAPQGDTYQSFLRRLAPILKLFDVNGVRYRSGDLK